MITQPYKIYVERFDPTCNMARFYALSISETLFGDTSVTRVWGRIGTRGQTMTHHFAHEKDAVILFLDLVRRKRRRGYAAVPVIRHHSGNWIHKTKTGETIDRPEP